MANKRKATFQPYDMDTAAGTNNSGVLMFGYALEDTDTVSSIISGGEDGGRDAPVYNAQDSVLWNNFRDCFRSEITQMYRSLRTSKALDYKDIMQRRHDHQSYWPEAMFNEDQYEKHLVPLINPVTVDDTTGELIRTDRYLTMIQGSKEEQFKWWLYNRFRYMDSKFVTGDAANNIISMRVFNSGTLTLTPAIDLYVGVSFGGGTTVALKRTTAGVSKSFVYQAETGVTEMETWIYSGDLIANLGDLSVFYGNEFDLSKATRLRRLKIGDPAANYSNTNLVTLDLRNMGLLEYVDLRNCPNLAIPINLEGSPRLEEAYFDGTAITGVDLAEGGSIETLHLPGTIATLTLINLSKLDDFQCPSFANVSRLMLSNMDQDVIDPIDVLAEILPNSQVNIQGLYLECESAQEIEGFLNILDTMQGVSRERGANGEWLYHDYDTAQVSGTIHTASLTGAQMASYNARYPYINVTADSVTSTLTYASYDGTTTYKTVTCLDGVPQDTAPANPTRPATAANTYTFAGWSKSMNSTTADADAQTGVIADRTIYAAYTAQARTYTVRFYNGSTLLETDTGVPYGGSTTYNGATPVSPDGSAEDYPFEGWNPTPTNIQGDTSCYAKFGSPVEDVEITDSWDTIIANIDNGTYTTKYKIGNYKPLSVGTEGTVNMQIVAFDTDELASGGYAPITFLAKELLATIKPMYESSTSDSDREWWKNSDLRKYLNNTILPLIPSNISARLQSVNKVQSTASSSPVVNGQTTVDKVWIPSIREVYSEKTRWETVGVHYGRVYKSANERIKKYGTSISGWWTRSADYYQSQFITINSSGYDTARAITDAYPRICLGFCLGLESETITDSWETILANENYATDYSIGDTKYLDLGTEGNVLMEIVAFNEDTRADGQGKAKITWISKGLLKTTKNMNASQKTVDGETAYTAGGWEHSDMRTYLKDTVKPLIPETVRNAIVPVTKVQSINTGGALVKDGQTTTDDVWIPSSHEVGFGTDFETTGAMYSNKFTNNASRIKKRNGSAKTWWLRSAYSSGNFRYVLRGGGSNHSGAYSAFSVALGFCT